MGKIDTAKLILRPGREKSLLRRHPWVFSGAVERADGNPGMGETVAVLAANGAFLAWAAYSPASQIRARVWSFDESAKIDRDFISAHLKEAVERRSSMDLGVGTNAYRLVNAESDGLPGLIVDRYDQTLVVQFLSAGAERWREEIAGCLADLCAPRAIYERSDVDVRELESLAPRSGLLAGMDPGERVEINENGHRFLVDVKNGHKTGFYLDQRPNRLRLAAWAKDREILNCFSYTGAFGVYGLSAGAKKVTSVDTSADALRLCGEHVRLNGLRPEQAETLECDVFHVLRSFRDQTRSFDLVILDPPKFAYNAAQVEKASRGYKDINLLAFKLLRPGGVLFTFSCSGAVNDDLFQKIVAGAALDAGVDARIMEYLHQGADHPTHLLFPEGAYLKGLVIQV